MYSLSRITALFILAIATAGCQTSPMTFNRFIYSCIDFNDRNAGETILPGTNFSSQQASLSVHPGPFANPKHLKINTASHSGGSGLDARFNNVVADISFDRQPESIVLQFGDLGGSLYLSINDSILTPTDFVSLDGQTIAGVDIYVDAITNGFNWYGMMTLVGPVIQLSIGGQELWVDNICGIEHADAVAVLDLRRNDATGPLPEFLTESLVSELYLNGIGVHKHVEGELNASILSDADVLVFFPKRGLMTDGEKVAVLDYIESGGSVLILGDYAGPNTAPISVYQDLFNIVGANHDAQVLGSGISPITLTATNFNSHVVTQGITSFNMYAATTVSGDGYDSIVHTASSTNPNNQLLIMGRSLGQGLVVVTGDATFVYDPSILDSQNKDVFMNIVEWLLP